MKVICDQCAFEYNLDASKIPATGAVVTCKQCSNKIKITPGGVAPSPTPTTPDAPIAIGDSGDDIADLPVPVYNDVELPSADASVAESTPPEPPPAPGGDPFTDLPAVDDGGPATPAMATAGQAIALGPVDDAPLQATAAPEPARNVDGLSDLPSPMSKVTDGQDDPFTDLPAPDDGSSGIEVVPPEFLDDLPAAIDSGTTDDLPNLFDDLPAPDTGGLDVADLPGSTEDPFAGRHLPTAAADIPSLMDDLPDLDTGDPGLEIETTAMSTDPDQAAALALDDLPTVAEGADPFSALAVERPATGDQPPTHASVAATATDAPPTPIAGTRRRMMIIGASVGGLLLVVALLFVGLPLLGVDLLGTLTGGTTPSKATDGGAATQPPDEPLPQNGTAPEAALEPPPPEPEPEPEPVALEKLTVDNVDRLPYAALKPGADDLEKAGTDTDLLQWSWYRLAAIHDDAEARDKLIANAAKRPDAPDVGPLGAAAGVGAMLLQGKLGAARRTAEKLRKRRHKDSAHVSYMAGIASSSQSARALKHFDRALKLNPDLVDAKIALGQTRLKARTPGDAAERLAGLAEASDDPEVLVRVASALIDGGALEPARRLIAQIGDRGANLAPTHRSALAKFRVRSKIDAGDLAGAVTAARQRVELSPTDVDAVIELVRFNGTPDDAESLFGAILKTADDETKGRVLVEKAQLALRVGAIGEARKAIANAKLPAKTSHWAKLAEGLVAQQAGNAAAAKAAYAAAARRPKFTKGKLAQLLHSPGKPAVLVSRLTRLAKQSDHPAVHYHLARAMHDLGNFGDALELVNAVIWSDPTVVPPTELLMLRVVLLDKTGAGQDAQALASKLHASRPDDRDLLRHLIELAARNEDTKAVNQWYEKLIELEPRNYSLRAQHAAILMQLGEDSQARGKLDQLQADPDAKDDPKVLYELGRAWAERDPVKARGFLLEARAKGVTAELLLLLGDIDEKRDKLDTALENYREALKLDPSVVDTRLRLARILLKKGMATEAEKNLRIVVKKNSENVEAHKLLGDTYAALEKPKDAIKTYQRLLATSGKPLPKVHMKIARLQLQTLGQLAPAVRSLKKVVALDPGNHDAYYLMGYALKDLNKRSEARRALEKFLELAPKDEVAGEVAAEVNSLKSRGR